MEATKPRLGRGLNALLGDGGERSRRDHGPVGKLSVSRIQNNPYQPRKRFDDDELQSLTAQHQDPRRPAAAGRPAGRRRLPAHRRRAAAAGRPGGRAGRGAGPRRRVRRPAGVRGGPRREHPAQRPEPDRKGPGLQGVPRHVRDDPGAARAEARPRPHHDQQPARPAEPARRSAGRGAARADHASATRRCSRACPRPSGRSRCARRRS